jgi:hypothetical protein
VLHPVPLDPEHESERTREHLTRAARGEGHDPKALDPFNFEKGGYALRYEDGAVYEVDEDTGKYFTQNGWAVELPEDVKVKRGDLAEPFDTRNVTDEDAERFEREELPKWHARQHVQTVRYIGTGTNEVVADDVHEGENVQVVDLGKGESADSGEGTTLDVHDATTESSSEV